MFETWKLCFLGRKDLLKIISTIFKSQKIGRDPQLRIPWTEEPGRPWSVGLQRVRDD